MKRVLTAALAALALAGAATRVQTVAAQELEPRSYVNTPVGFNFLLANYGYTDGYVVFSAAAPPPTLRSRPMPVLPLTFGPWI